VTAASVAFDNQDLAGKGPLPAFVAAWAPTLIRFLLLLVAGLIVFGMQRWNPLAGRFKSAIAAAPVRWRWFFIHAGAVGLLAPAASTLYWGSATSSVFTALAFACAVLAAVAAAAAVLWAVPASLLALAARTLGAGWLLASAVALAATFGGALAQTLWRPSASLTFRIVQILLQPFLPTVASDPSRLVIGSESFAVEIAAECSGYEGVALALAFSASWLWFFRHEYRFPAALLLVPAAAAAMWILNSFRIVALILIGHSGFPGVAMGGFHSQAGWIAFIVVAIGLCLISRRIALFAVSPETGAQASHAGSHPVAAYLMPFLAILGASMVSKTVSGTFEWLYPLRFIGAAIALWIYRREYASVSWRAGWHSAVAGIAVFAMWIGFDRSGSMAMSPELAAMPAVSRAIWITVRVLGAVITVPVAEELAFRGFLMRRLTAENFEAVSWRAFGWMPFLVSSAAFGALHGGRWMEGTFAGMAYAYVMIRSGRLGDAVAAHAVTNALLAALVLMGGKWQFW
jgi:exosortase E/protease (VPEID-CTERM system)